MYNPLLEDLTQLKDTELESKIADLNKKYMMALRLGNGMAAEQIVVILDAMKFEGQRRQAEAMKRLAQNQNKDLDKLININ